MPYHTVGTAGALDAMVSGRAWGEPYDKYADYYNRAFKNIVKRAYDRQAGLVETSDGRLRSEDGKAAPRIPSDECLQALHPDIKVHRDTENPWNIQSAEPFFPETEEFVAWLKQMDRAQLDSWHVRVRHLRKPDDKDYKDKYNIYAIIVISTLDWLKND